MIGVIKQALLAIAILVLGFYGLLAWQLSGSGEGTLPSDHADVRQVRSLFSSTQFEMLESYAVSGNWSGDIERGFKAHIEGVSIDELEQLSIVQRGDEFSPDYSVAADFVLENFGGADTNWVPAPESVKTSDYYLYPLSVEAQTQSIDSARLVLVSPANQLLYYFWLEF